MTGAKTHKVGETVQAKGEVIRPDETRVQVDGDYVLDVPGTHVVNGEDVKVK